MKLTFLFLFVVSFSFLNAQPLIDVASVRAYSMPQTFKDSTEERTANTTWITAGLDLPLKIKEDYLLLSPFFEKYSLAENDKKLYGVAFPLTFIHQTKNPLWKTAFAFIPRISADFEKIAPNTYQYGAAALAIYKKKENLKYKFGVYYNSEHFGFFMIPLLGIDWNINEKWNLYGILPGSLNLEYKMMKCIYTGLAFRSITNSFRTLDHTYYKIEDNHLRLFADFYLTKHLVLAAEAGHSILRKYSYGFKKEHIKTETDLGYKDGLVYELALSWRIRLDEKKVP